MKDDVNNIGIKDWAEEDRPREKLLINGHRNLTDAELIAILIASGNKNETAVDLSKRILNFYNNDLNKLSQVSINELTKFKGIGEAKAITIVAALELARRKQETTRKERKQITSSEDVYQLFRPTFTDLNHEEFWILLLNKGNFALGQKLISKGAQARAVADPKIIFKIALEQNATQIILLHNHPSGNRKPSKEDISLTKKMVESGKMLDLPVVDHLIITDTSYYSFLDEGLM